MIQAKKYIIFKGGIGTIGGDISGLNLPVEGNSITERISFICGTSSCHMAVSIRSIYIISFISVC